MDMIVASGLSRNFGSFVAVDSIDFRIGRGQVVGFLGPNGAGKTTTIRMLAGYLTPSAGSISVDGQDVVRSGAQARQRIGYLPEAAPLYSEMRVREYLAFRARLFGVPRPRRRAVIDKAVQRCLLREVQGRPIHQLSKGFRQRVGLAGALLHEPPVMILDEPTVGLDPGQILEIRALIRELGREQTILLSTHILPEVESTCDRLIMIARGRIWTDGTIAAIRAAEGRGAGLVCEAQSSEPERLAATLRKVSGVKRVEVELLEAGWRRMSIDVEGQSSDLREPVARAISQAGGAIRELHRQAPSLEEIFMRVVARAEEDHARRQGAGARSAA
jgi:ABC-2 type transport system ATP-binding protein